MARYLKRVYAVGSLTGTVYYDIIDTHKKIVIGEWLTKENAEKALAELNK